MKYLQNLLLKKHSEMNIDRIYYIKCDHILDRKLHIESLLSSININNDIIQRVIGVYIP